MIDVLTSLRIALAQAGGGGSFGGGGGGGGFGGGGGGFGGGGGGGFGGGGFSGGGGGGGGDLDGGGFVVFLVIVVIVMLLNAAGRSQQDTRITRTIRQGVKVQEEALRQQALAQIVARDPAFDMATFLRRAGKGFVTTQHAWSDQDLRSCRPFISDGVHERFQLYIRMQQAEGIRNRMRDVQLVGWEVVALASEPHFDTIHVRFTARAITYNESLTSGRRVSGGSDTSPTTFTEIWSFSRRPGVPTRADASLLEGSCPNCGNVLEIVDRAVCQACGSVVNSGAYDWVLAEITQDEEWIVPSSRTIPGFAELGERDPGLNEQHLEDRASVVFWRCMMAVYFEDIAEAAPVLPPGTERVPARWDAGADRYWFTPAVGSVEVVAAQAAEGGRTGGGASDRVHVQVRWSASPATGDRRSPRILAPQEIHTDVVVLRRDAGVRSNAEHTFTSFSCTNCGGPLDVGKMTECRFCGTPVNDGSTDWVLDDVLHHDQVRGWLAAAAQREQQVRRGGAQATGRGAGASEGGPVPPPLPAAPGGVPRLADDRLADDPGVLVAVARMVAADGHVDEAERQLLTQLAQARGIPLAQVQRIIATGEAADIPVTLPSTPAEQQAFLDHLIRGALLDGRITKPEHDLLEQVAGRMGWARADLDRAIKRHRRELYRQARAIVRDAPPHDPRLDPPPPPDA